jgi:cytochrome P450
MSSRVPGPRFSLPSLVHFAVDPYGFFRAAKRRYGDPFKFTVGGRPLVVTGEPELARVIFTTEPEATRAFAPEALVPVLGKHSLIVISGAEHRRDRKLLTPPFHGARMKKYGAIIRESALRRAAAWKVGEPFVMQRTTQAISLDVILRAVFGVSDPGRQAVVERAMLDALDTLHPAMLFSPLMQRDLGPLTPWRKFTRARDRGLGLVRSEIAARRDTAPGDDILSMMLAVRDEDGRGMSDDELVDELNTLLLAGHETTAIALAWAFYWLLRTPDALARLRAELAGLGPDPDSEAVAALPWLDAVCHEVLRLYPILPLAPRTLLRPLKLGPHDLEPGDAIGVAITLIHEHPDLYPEPGKFKPERFLGRKPSPFEFVPFGGGHRRCIGAAFAMYELKLALAAIVPTYELKLVRDVPARPVRRNLSLGPRGGVEVVRVA